MSGSGEAIAPPFVIRHAGLNDIAEILRQRRGMYFDMGSTDTGQLDAMVSVSDDYLRKALADRSFRAWIAPLMHLG